MNLMRRELKEALHREGVLKKMWENLMRRELKEARYRGEFPWHLIKESHEERIER